MTKPYSGNVYFQMLNDDVGSFFSGEAAVAQRCGNARHSTAASAAVHGGDNAGRDRGMLWGRERGDTNYSLVYVDLVRILLLICTTESFAIGNFSISVPLSVHRNLLIISSTTRKKGYSFTSC